MVDEAAIQATFADFQLVKSRKQARFIFEVPMELADNALRTLGGLPLPDESRWVGIARLNPKAGAEQSREGAPSKPKRRWHEMLPSQRAAILCHDEAFQKWAQLDTEEETAEWLRQRCGVFSRRHLDQDDEARKVFERIEEDFQIAAGRVPPPR